MNESEIIQSVQAEIGKLQRVLDLLLNHSGATKEVQLPGRSRASGQPATSSIPKTSSPRKRVMSEAGKARIAAAQKQRWAAQKTASPSRTSGKQAAAEKRTRKTAEPTQKVVLTTTRKKSVDGQARTGSAQSASATSATTHAARKKARKRTGATKSVATKTSAKRAGTTKTAATKTGAKKTSAKQATTPAK